MLGLQSKQRKTLPVMNKRLKCPNNTTYTHGARMSVCVLIAKEGLSKDEK